MIAKLRSSIRDESGQGMTEYIIIVALIAIAAIGVVSIFGDNIRKLFAASTTALSGDENPQLQTRGLNSEQGKHKKLDNFQENQL